ncbi:MAG: 6-phosphogluconolactonase [Fibrobacterota bacterium]
MRKLACGDMSVIIGKDTAQMAAKAAEDFAESVRMLLSSHADLNVIFSGAESQGAFHAALCARRDIAWNRLNAFAVDEFYAPGIPVQYTICAQPRRDLYSHVHFKSVNIISHAPKDVETERKRYEALIDKHLPHICCLGLGISGHLALNEPGSTDFHDTQRVRLVKICDASKQQLMQDPNFQKLGTIPDSGLTITLPTLMSARVVMAVVPYAIKADVIAEFWKAKVSPEFPASILKTKTGSKLYLDSDSFSKVGK